MRFISNMKWMLLAGLGIAYGWSSVGDAASKDEAPEWKVRPAVRVPADGRSVRVPVATVQRTPKGVQTQMRNLQTAIHWYLDEHAKLPDGSAGLQTLARSRYVSFSEIVDPWSREFRFHVELVGDSPFDQEYAVSVFSDGPDRLPGTEDDITLD